MSRIILTASACLLLWSCTKQPTLSPKIAGSANEHDTHVSVDPQTQKQLDIAVEPATSGAVDTPITATGQLQLNQNSTWQVGAIIEGKVVAVAVNVGDKVKAGQIVAQMHSHEVHDSRATRRQAVAELNRLKLLAEQSLRVRDRTQRLFDLKAASREQLEAAETQYRAAQLSVSTAQAEVDKADFHLTEFLDVPLSDKTPSGAEVTDADRVPIKSPAGGTVMERVANVGTVVSIGDPVVTVSDLSSLWLIAAINEAELSHIRVGQPVRISVRAYPDRVFPGKVFQLGERMDPQTRTLQVRVLVSNSGGLLKPDMYATVELDSPAQRSSISVPDSAVQELNGKTVVFVRTKEGEFSPREITAGRRLDKRVEVLSGLDPGTPVVVRGAMILKSQLLKDSE